MSGTEHHEPIQPHDPAPPQWPNEHGATNSPDGAAALAALRALTFTWTQGLEDVWAPSPYHVEGLHSEIVELVRRGIDQARASAGTNPLGIVLRGERGVGKTHLLGWVRQEVRRNGGYFFLVSVASGKTFWEEVLRAVVVGLQPRHDGDRGQMGTLLDDLADRTGLAGAVRAAVTGRAVPSRKDVDAFVRALRDLDRTVGLGCQDVARSLVLLASPEQEHQDIGYYFLSGVELEPDERRPWGIRSQPKRLEFLITELSRLIALSGPTVMAIDQIDPLIDDMRRAEEIATPEARQMASEVLNGLMTLRDLTRRTLTIVSCLPDRWEFVRKHAVDTVADRFRHPPFLQNIPSADVGRKMIEKRFTVEYAGVGFTPPYPTWPVRPEAFARASDYTARRLLKRIEAHVGACLRDGVVRELDRLGDWETESSEQPPAVRHAGHPDGRALPDDAALADLDARFEQLRAGADVAAAFDPKHEDPIMLGLLDAGLKAWIMERGEDDDPPFLLEAAQGRPPSLHACLSRTIDEQTERQRLWGFRGIASDNAKAVLGRLRGAVAKTGLDRDSPERKLFIIRNTNWPTGPTTARETRAFEENGGVAIAVAQDDLKTFAALRTMLELRHPSLGRWLAVRRPASGTELLSLALGDVPPPAPGNPPVPPVTLDRSTPSGQPVWPAPDVEPPATGLPGAGGSAVRVGTTVVGGAPAYVELQSLPKHTAIFAGSGSGKTVLIRRVVEECALHGISAIVLDPNNDLARLGDAWPEAPKTWIGDDADRAREYLATTDVVVWTPGRQGGRPLVFQPMPAFADVLDSADEFDAAVYAAVDAFAPRVNANKATDKARLERAVLTEGLKYFGRGGGGSLAEFIAMLNALPQDASTLARAPGVAADLAEKLEVARIGDPLFGGAGQPADPGILLTPPPGRRARVSVISMIGLPGEEQRQSFVNQLQMALFSWVKRHPARGDTPSGLLVMDEAQTLAPALGSTPSTQSSIRLASQARKYGLGLVFATQAPRGLHNQISGNASTQMFGRLNHPAQIESARDLARAKGGDIRDIGGLGTGVFYLTTEGRGFHKIRTPMCLSHHPPSPLTEEEVIARARRRAGG
jgi:hypothetical protein